MSTTTLVTAAVGSSALAWLIMAALRVGRREPDMPPGPPTLPILGNLHVFPTNHMYIKFTEWAKIYGDIYSLKLANGTAIILGSLEAVWQLLEEQSNLTGNRPASTVATMVADDLHFGTLSKPDARWRSYNRAAKMVLSPSAAESFKPLIEAETSQFLYDLLREPEGFYDHTRRWSGSIALSAVCGTRAPQITTEYIREFYKLIVDWVHLLEFGAILDLAPALNYLPEIFAPWKAQIRRVRPWMQKLWMSTVEDCEDRKARGSSNGCALETIRERAEDWGLTRPMVGFLGGTLVEAGADTSAVTIQNTILMAMSNPEAQQRAQEEIDRVVGSDRLPTYEDIARMPYVKAFILEVSRLKPTAPLSFPRAAAADATYKGYRIPSGSTIFVNYWQIARDPALFDDPEMFMPERYLQHPQGFGKPLRDRMETHPSNKEIFLKLWPEMAFGVGKRKCPGVYVARNEVDLGTVRLLWAFKFNKPRDPSGKTIDVNVLNDKPGILGAPNPFPCDIKVRSPDRAELIRQSYRDAESIMEPFEQELSEADREWVAASRGH